MRRIIGIFDRDTVMLAVRELVNKKMAYFSKIKPKGRFFGEFSNEHLWLKLTEHSKGDKNAQTQG